MVYTQELPKNEQLKLYMKIPKKKLAEMLYNANQLIKSGSEIINSISKK